jgi:hypothetical protein
LLSNFVKSEFGYILGRFFTNASGHPTWKSYELHKCCQIFHDKIPIWAYFEGLGMENFFVFHGHLVFLLIFWYIYFMVVWNLLCHFGIFFPILVSCTKMNLATPNSSRELAANF